MDAEVVRLIVELGMLIIMVAGILARLSSLATRFEMIGKQQASEIKELKEAVKELIQQTARLDRIDERQLAEGKRVDELTARFNRLANSGGKGI